ncbi:DEAD/DEAH box helicase [Burkholderia vietnamiensis]|uniref:DEAD/DEAH box helicase n=1 Tax=Burkholderia vietnamiensis TaxID=60552 RepID=UPI00159072C4|nr:DEAD/DEAH box helicase [Burkholderia vietnamiensis]
MIPYFSELFPVLAERAKLSATSRLGFANAPLQRHLSDVFGRPYGEPGAFLADPTFEAVFGWHSSDSTMSDLAGSLLTDDLIRAMDAPPAELAGEYRFASSQRPYEHQLAAWKVLTRETPQSLVVASGTGSGKTECFMVPILDRLCRLRAQQQSKLIGVRALFLYPLNALINSQRERLRAWTDAFGEDVRFCLYNGTTPEKLPERSRQAAKNEVTDRETLRASPPPILVTNSTMLEYMLVRTADAPILAQSQGKLEWVVLDEAHTYVGSQAAEASLLIRRVLHGFGVTSDQVRFVATSATIGDPEGEAGKKLKQFLADVAGVSPDRVHLVAGKRRIPSMVGQQSHGAMELDHLVNVDSGQEKSSQRYEALTGEITARKLRDLFVGDPERQPVQRLSDVCAALFGKGSNYSVAQQHEALRWLDLLSGTRDSDGEVFLPLRAHGFHQTLSGLWACADAACSHKVNTHLSDANWPFGQVYLDPRKHCDCGSPVYEVISCGDCGTVHLLAGAHRGVLTHLQPQAALDEFELEVESNERAEEDDEDNDAEPPSSKQSKVLIVNRPLQHVGPLDIDRTSRQITEPSGDTLRVLAHEDGGEGLMCPVCSGTESAEERLFQSSRLGAPFLLGGILPTLLEFAPDGDKPADHPCRGRRLLTFNDSRQGTARIAAKLQQDAERNRVRGLVYHLALQYGRGQASAQTEALKNDIRALEAAQAITPIPALDQMLAGKKAELAKLTRPAPIPFNDLAQQLANQGRDFDDMLAHYRRLSPGTFGDSSGPVELARMFLVREFGRRPKRLNNLESMGLVAVQYPALEILSQDIPAAVRDVGLDYAAWKDFLKICLDFYIRGGGSLAITPSWRNWLGIPFPQTQLVSRDEQETGRTQRRWPRAKRSGMQSVLVRILAYAIKADITSAYGEDRVDAVLLAAWETLGSLGLLTQSGNGRVLALSSIAFSPVAEAWVCPVTRRFLDTTLRGISPYLPKQATDETALCQKVAIPLYDEPFGNVTDDLERIRRGREWLADQNDITLLRTQSLWSDLNDRVIELAPYFTTAEHSAQQDSQTLDRYEKLFKAGDLNLLSCSTTMEMGIDIGGISEVAMNNVPPHPANYLQRAGRAGRRKEARSLAMTLCKANPHDQSVFSKTRWAFDTPLPAPRVSLDSAAIVQRHVHSLLLSRFLADALVGSGQEQTKLACGPFFIGKGSLVERFVAWCSGKPHLQSTQLESGLRQLLRNSIFEGLDLARVLDKAADEMSELADSWRIEWENLEREANEIRKGGESSPAFRAVELHQKRLRDEYLLRELATRGFLPGYGFPTHIASFDNLTYGRMSRQKASDSSRDDNRYRRRELASRDLMTALREYAPGSEVVMDGLVYRSAGVTLNWHIPADQQNAREIQDIRHAWRCQHCGASGSTHSLEAARRCDACGQDIEANNIREFLEPAGFAVDFYREPGNDVSTQHFVPVEPPWINARDPWNPLPNPELGQFRSSVKGHVFHQSRGINGTGYALCLECGRAEPMQGSGAMPAVFERPHTKLRRAKEDGLFCKGSDSPWKIKYGITLGHEAWTDVLEIQLKSEDGVWLNDSTVALTLAVALRDSMAEALGVQATELGCDIKPSKPAAGQRCQSILIFDRYAAGYASSAERYLGTVLFQEARKRLNCLANCDSACPHCVLDFDQRFAAENLNRRAALEFLSENWLAGLHLPEQYAFFGSDSRPEYSPLTEAIWMAVRRNGTGGVRLFTGGENEAWDIAPSPLRDFAYRLAGHEIPVEIVIPDQAMSHLDESDRFLLASLSDHSRISIRTIKTAQRCGAGWLVAETIEGATIRWGIDDENAIAFGPAWGTSKGLLIRSETSEPATITTAPLTAAIIRPKQLDAGDREVEIHHELDGPLQGFGKRLWKQIAEHHPATQLLLDDEDDDLVSLTYRDRYLFTPLSVAVLAELVGGLRELIGQARWASEPFRVVTTNRRATGENTAKNTVWSDWPEMETRNAVLKSTLSYIGVDTIPVLADNSSTGHGRLLEIEWSSGKKLTLRLDQGVSYWRAAHSTNPHARYFDFGPGASDAKGKQLAELAISLEGAQLPTQLFAKVRCA